MDSDNALISLIMEADTPHMVGQPAFVEEGKKSIYKWLKTKDGTYAMVQDSETVDAIDNGIYVLFQDNRGGIYADSYNVTTDELYELPNKHISKIMHEIEDFMSKEKTERFKKANLKHKRGVLLHGTGGTGKTSTVIRIAKKLVSLGVLVFMIRNTNELMWYIAFMQDNFRIAHPDLPVAVLIEDIDKFMDNGGVESTVLNWLNGPDEIDHQVVVATTNYYDQLNDLLLRPSRFDQHIPVDKPSELEREAYLVFKGLEEEESKSWGKDTDDFSFAELKELYVAVKLLDLDYEEAKVRINKQAAAGTSHTGKRSKRDSEKLGFFANKKS